MSSSNIGEFKVISNFDNKYNTKIDIDSLSSTIVSCYAAQIISSDMPPCVNGYSGTGITIITFGNKGTWRMQIVYNQSSAIFSLRKCMYNGSVHIWNGWKQ